MQSALVRLILHYSSIPTVHVHIQVHVHVFPTCMRLMSIRVSAMQSEAVHDTTNAGTIRAGKAQGRPSLDPPWFLGFLLSVPS